ncbi:MAG: NADH-quinone oxidoreductase subunit NuoF [Candidatus Thermoplasmatota archaeon]
MKKIKNPEELRNLRKAIQDGKDPDKTVVTVCKGTGCVASGSEPLINAFREEIEKRKIQDRVEVRVTGCHGFCEKGPIVVIYPSRIFYPMVIPEKVPAIISETVLENRIIEDMLYVDPTTGEKIIYEHDVPFYKKQTRTILANNGLIDPTSIEDYIGTGGYFALAKALTSMTPEEIISEVKASGLRGRGGAGFPTGVKWEFCRAAKGEQKYIICNGDEGDPGAYMDRSVLEGNPHSVIEGMIIGAYAIGASKGVAYVRAEYPLAVHNLDIAINQAKELGLLGDNILGSGFDFELWIYRGGGAFVCGEESALIASIEGRSGEPRQRPPFPAQSGLWGCPTNINNVETWANVPHIISRGAEWYASIGTESSKGTKIFSLVGKVNNTGLVEVPFGTTLRTIIFEIGGGIPGARKFKAVQSGGPSGGCIPAEHIDTQVDYAELTKLGSIMGSGGLIVMDEDTCMVDVARYFISFTLDESCGKCTSCREGNAQMLEMLKDICDGKGKESYLPMLEELCGYIKETSMCALGGTAPNPVLTTLRYFRDEYMAHIQRKECPAKVCKALIFYQIDPEKCTGCGMCAKKCPMGAISGERRQPHVIDREICTRCGTCHATCKFDAILVRTGGG